MNEKYEFVGEPINDNGHILRQIVAKRDIYTGSDLIHAGTMGGWIESEENLCTEDSSWIGEGIHVYGSSRICKDSLIMRNFISTNSEEFGYMYPDYSRDFIRLAVVNSFVENSVIRGNHLIMYNSSVSCTDISGDNTSIELFDSSLSHDLFRNSRISLRYTDMYNSRISTSHTDFIGVYRLNAHGKRVVQNLRVDSVQLLRVYGLNVLCSGEVSNIELDNVSNYNFIIPEDYEEINIRSSMDFLPVENVGSRNDKVMFFRSKSDKIYVVTGCFRGRLDEFIEAVKDTHNQNPFYIEEYMMAIEIAKHRIMRNDHHEIVKRNALAHPYD